MSGPTCVVDASALLALLYGEPGAERVAAAMRGSAFVSAVNWCEVLGKLEDRGWPANPDFSLRFRRLRAALEILAFDEAAAGTAAGLRRPTRHANLSLADRSCLATGLLRNLPVLTADRPWADLRVGVAVELIR